MSGLVWKDDSYAADRIEAAIAETNRATLRLQMMKANCGRARAAQGTFPFPGHRTVAEWI